MLLFGHRYYEPQNARFISRDPIGYEGGINLYAYCGNNPIMGIDPSGLDDDDDDDGLDWDHMSLGRGLKGRNVNKSIHQGATRASRALKFAAKMNPIVNGLEALVGKDMTEHNKRIGMGARIMAGLSVLGSMAGFGGGKVAVAEYDVVNYSRKAAGLENHHGILDVWAKFNVSGYASRAADNPTIALSIANHAATKAVYRAWLKQKTGREVGGVVNWNAVTWPELYQLSERMFNAAHVPSSTRRKYYEAFYKYITK